MTFREYVVEAVLRGGLYCCALSPRPLRAALARLEAAAEPTPDPKGLPAAKADKRGRRPQSSGEGRA